MSRVSTVLFLAIATPLFGIGGALRAADAPAAEAKLRESLRATLLQMRTLQGERDALQSAKDQSEQEKKALSDKLETVTKQAAADQQASEKTASELKAKNAEQEAELARLRESLDKWKASQKQAVELAQTKENERTKLAGTVIELQRKVADQQTKNAAMHKLAKEILDRYEKFGLGTAITAREPFVGTMKVKLQNLVQDYEDKLSEQRIKP